MFKHIYKEPVKALEEIKSIILSDPVCIKHYGNKDNETRLSKEEINRLQSKIMVAMNRNKHMHNVMSVFERELFYKIAAGFRAGYASSKKLGWVILRYADRTIQVIHDKRIVAEINDYNCLLKVPDDKYGMATKNFIDSYKDSLKEYCKKIFGNNRIAYYHNNMLEFAAGVDVYEFNWEIKHIFDEEDKHVQ